MKAPKDYIVFPLDMASIREAARYIELLSDSVGMFKVGLELFVNAGPEIVRMIQSAGRAEIFLDLKFHDIPATVERATAQAAALGVKFLTVHCGETPRMLAAAVAGADGRVEILGVTVLTSVSPEDLASAGFKDSLTADMTVLVKKRAQMAKAAGCAGVVCSGQEVGMVKERFGKSFYAVTPGIRPAWQDNSDDQRRIVTPGDAIKKGSDYLVIGRPIRDADDPKAAAGRIADEIEAALNQS